MRIGIIGPGRVGTALGVAFKKAGYEITGIVSRCKKDAFQCMELTGCGYWASEPQDLVNISSLLLITVPDSEIKNVVAKLSPKQGTILVHTSGSLASSILNAEHSIAMHPIASFAGGELVRGTYFGIEGDIKIGKRLVRSIGGIPIVISSEQKALYHAALNFGASYILTLLHKGCELLKLTGVPGSGGMEIRTGKSFPQEAIIISLAESTLRNAKNYGIKKSFTGPVERKDIKVVREELKAIKESCPEDLEIYNLLIKETEKILME